MAKFDRILCRAVLWICGVLMLVMAVLIFSQVLARYLFHHSLSWTEELGRYIFVWMTFLGLAGAYPKGSHVALDLLLRALHGKMKRGLILVNGILMTILAIVIIYSGCNLISIGIGQQSSALLLPMNLVYLVIPVSGVLLLYFVVRQTFLSFLLNDSQKTLIPKDDD
jgi:TRAP-type C4-dicarboxylate transport system permease small subunit